MKVLTIDSHFLLPDDFEGDVNDALEELVKYRREKARPRVKMEGPEPEPFNSFAYKETRDELWEIALKVFEDGFRHAGGIGLNVLNDENEWEDMGGKL